MYTSSTIIIYEILLCMSMALRGLLAAEGPDFISLIYNAITLYIDT